MGTKPPFCTHVAALSYPVDRRDRSPRRPRGRAPEEDGSGMEVKPGYKQTEVGVIPEEWDVRALPNVSWFQEGPGLRNWQFTSTGMKVINVTNLENAVLNLERTDRHISISEF